MIQFQLGCFFPWAILVQDLEQDLRNLFGFLQDFFLLRMKQQTVVCQFAFTFQFLFTSQKVQALFFQLDLHQRTAGNRAT